MQEDVRDSSRPSGLVERIEVEAAMASVLVRATLVSELAFSIRLGGSRSEVTSLDAVLGSLLGGFGSFFLSQALLLARHLVSQANSLVSVLLRALVRALM